MNIQIKKFTGWLLSGLVGLMLSASAIDKIIGTEHALQMSTSFGLSERTYLILGIIEILSVIVFINPRTGILGTLLLSAYLGGAIATHLQHSQGIIFPIFFEALVWIAAVIRFPEVAKRILSKQAP